MPVLTPRPLPANVWGMIAGHCTDTEPAYEIIGYAIYKPQQDLASLMRVSTTLHNAAAPHLYKDISVIKLPSLLYGLPPPTQDVPSASASGAAVNDTLPGTASAKRMGKLDLLKLVRRIHLVNVINLPWLRDRATPDEIAAHAARTSELTNNWTAMLDVLRAYSKAYAPSTGGSHQAKLLLPALKHIKIGPIGSDNILPDDEELYKPNIFASLFVPLTPAAVVCDRDETGMLGYSAPVIAPPRRQGVANMTYIRHINHEESRIEALWGADNVILFNRVPSCKELGNFDPEGFYEMREISMRECIGNMRPEPLPKELVADSKLVQRLSATTSITIRAFSCPQREDDMAMDEYDHHDDDPSFGASDQQVAANLQKALREYVHQMGERRPVKKNKVVVTSGDKKTKCPVCGVDGHHRKREWY